MDGHNEQFQSHKILNAAEDDQDKTFNVLKLIPT